MLFPLPLLLLKLPSFYAVPFFDFLIFLLFYFSPSHHTHFVGSGKEKRKHGKVRKREDRVGVGKKGERDEESLSSDKDIVVLS